MSMQKDKSASKVKVDYKNMTFNLTTDLKSPVDILGNIIAAKGSRVILISDFKNISDKKINTITFEVECFDGLGRPVKNIDNNFNNSSNIIEKIMSNLLLLPGKNLSKKVVVDLSQLPLTRKVNITIKEVIFEDATSWEYDQNNIVITDYHPFKEKDLEIIKKFTGEDLISMAELKKDKWICVCGRNNHVNNSKCPRCNRYKFDVLIDFSIEHIDETISIYKDKLQLDNKLKEKRKIANQKKLKSKRVKRKLIPTFIVLASLILIIYFSVNVIYPQVKLRNVKSEVSSLFEMGQYNKILDVYSDHIDDVGMDDVTRGSILNLAVTYANSDDYDNLNDILAFLSSNDEKYKPTYQLAINEIKSGNNNIAKQLVYQMDLGNLQSGDIQTTKDIVVGLNFNDDFYSPLRQYRELVTANVYMEYKDGKLMDDNTYVFTGHKYDGSNKGWTTAEYMYIGDVVGNTLEGQGDLYIYDSLWNRKGNSFDKTGSAYVKLYEGGFKSGKFDGKGTIYWSNNVANSSNNEEYMKKEQFTLENIVETGFPLIEAEFADGNIIGAYNRYHYDGQLVDTGVVSENEIASSSYGKIIPSEYWPNIRIAGDVNLVDEDN